MSPETLNRVGLWFGLISGLLLIPEVLNLLPIDRMEQIIEKWLGMLENWSSIPQRLHPQSWKWIFSEESRQKIIEPITAILGLLSSATWTVTIALGIYISSRFFILLGLMLPIYVTIERISQFSVKDQPKTKYIIFFFYGLFLTLIIAPPISLVRVVILISRAIILPLRSIFVRHKVLRTAIIIMAICLFIISNILQLIATY